MITLKTLAQATEQEVFDQVARHLLTQKVRSENENNLCLYRNGDLKCAAGCLIGDDEYDPRIEDWNWRRLVQHGTVPREHARLISQLQRVHDTVAPEYWKVKLKGLASNDNLIWRF